MRLALAEPAPVGHAPRAFAVIAVLVLLAARFFPFDRISLYSCPLRTYAHVPCPACGMTRAFVGVAHGDLGAAFKVSPLGTVLAFGAIGLVLYVGARLWFARRGVTLQTSPGEWRALRIGAVAVVLANWVYLLVSGAAT